MRLQHTTGNNSPTSKSRSFIDHRWPGHGHVLCTKCRSAHPRLVQFTAGSLTEASCRTELANDFSFPSACCCCAVTTTRPPQHMPDAHKRTRDYRRCLGKSQCEGNARVCPDQWHQPRASINQTCSPGLDHGGPRDGIQTDHDASYSPRRTRRK